MQHAMLIRNCSW